MNSPLSKLLKFTKLILDFRGVKRTMDVPAEGRFENDVEHSYELAMQAWFFIAQNNLDLNKDLVLKYALVHDLVETYAGDVDPYLSSASDIQEKKTREEKALEYLQKEFGDFEEMISLIRQYEAKEDRESRFVYTLDKLQPVMNAYSVSAAYYRNGKITFEQWKQYNREKVKGAPEIEKLFDELVGFLEPKRDEIFFKAED